MPSRAPWDRGWGGLGGCGREAAAAAAKRPQRPRSGRSGREADELASEVYHSRTAGPVVRRQHVELLSPGEVVLPDERTNAGDKGSGASHAKGVAP